MIEHADRLTTITRWLQELDDPLLYSPDGLAPEDSPPPAAHRAVTAEIIASRLGGFSGRLCHVLGVSAEHLLILMGAACQSVVEEAITEEGEAEDAIPWGPMPRGGPLYEAWADWAAGATAPELEACHAAGIPYSAFRAVLDACAPRETAQELRAQREAACDE